MSEVIFNILTAAFVLLVTMGFLTALLLFSMKYFEIRMKQRRWAVYTGASAAQVMRFDDPRKFLVEGRRYEVLEVEVQAWVTSIRLKNYPDLRFNSVCFDLDISSDIKAWQRTHGGGHDEKEKNKGGHHS